MTGFGRAERHTSTLASADLSEWDTETLRETFDGKAKFYDEVEEHRDHPERWSEGTTWKALDDRLTRLSHGLTLIEDELMRRGEMRSPGKGGYRPMT